MANANNTNVSSNLVDFNRVLVTKLSDFNSQVNSANTIYVIGTDLISFDSTNEFHEHCLLLDYSEENENEIYTYKLKKGEAYLYAQVFIKTDELPEPDLSYQLIPLTTRIDKIFQDEDFNELIKDSVAKAAETSGYVTRNQLRIRSNNIQAWVVNNFIAKTASGDAGFTPGTIKVSKTDPEFGYISEKLISSDESIEIEKIGNESEGEKLDLRAKYKGIAFADAELVAAEWGSPDQNGFYTVDFMNNSVILDAFDGPSDKYKFIRNVDVYSILDENTRTEFNVDKYYSTYIYTNPVTGVETEYNYLRYIKTKYPTQVYLVLYLTNGTAPKDSGGSSGGDPDNYLVSAEILNDGKTLKITKNKGTPRSISFTPATGAEELAELKDFITSQDNPQGANKLAMFNSFLDILVDGSQT